MEILKLKEQEKQEQTDKTRRVNDGVGYGFLGRNNIDDGIGVRG
jgi:hypothetical protein